MVHTKGKSLQDWLGDIANLWNDLGFSLCTTLSDCYIVITLDKGKKSKIEMSTNEYITIKHQRLSLMRVIFVDYQTSELQCNYQSYIQVDIEDTWNFSGYLPYILQTMVCVHIITVRVEDNEYLSLFYFSFPFYFLFSIFVSLFIIIRTKSLM